MAGARRLAPWSLDVLRWWLWESCFARRSSSCNVLVAESVGVLRGSGKLRAACTALHGCEQAASNTSRNNNAPCSTGWQGVQAAAHATALAICAHTSPPCGPCAREIKNALLHTWGYEGCPWTSNDCAQASHTEKNARAHDFSQKRCDALRSVTVARKRRADSFRAAGQWPTIHTTRPVRQHYL